MVVPYEYDKEKQIEVSNILRKELQEVDNRYQCVIHVEKNLWRNVMYSIKERVRYSETDKSGHLTLTGIVNYFQDCSTFQSEDLGVGMEF